MWAIYGLLSALFGGINGVMSKKCTKMADAHLIIALRTAVAFAIAWGVVLWCVGLREIAAVDGKSLLFLTLSGIAAAGGWYGYFSALLNGSACGVAAMDKLSVILVMLGGWLFLGERMTALKVISMVLMAIGVLLMVEKMPNTVDKTSCGVNASQSKRGWIGFSVLSVLLVSASALLSKIGVESVDSRLAFAIRTTVVLLISEAVYWSRRDKVVLKALTFGAVGYIGLSGVLLAVGWLFYFQALSTGDAGSVHSVDKLGVFITVMLTSILRRESIRLRVGVGLILLCVGISLLMMG